MKISNQGSATILCALLSMSILWVAPAGGVLSFVEVQRDNTNGVDGLAFANFAVLSPDGRHVYIAGGNDRAVAVFERDATAGGLTFIEARFDAAGGIDGLGSPQGLAMSPDGRHLYVAGSGTRPVAVFERDASTGALSFFDTLIAIPPGIGRLELAHFVLVSPDGLNVCLIGDNAVAMFGRDATTGALTFIEAHFGGVPFSAAFSPDGRFLYVAASADMAVVVYQRDAATGVLSQVETQVGGIGGVDGLEAASSVVVSPDGRHVYVASAGEHTVATFERDGSTGRLDFVAARPEGVAGVGLPGNMAIDESHLFVPSLAEDLVAVFDRDPLTGILTFREAQINGIGGVFGIRGPSTVAVSPDGRHLLTTSRVDDAVAVFSIETLPGCRSSATSLCLQGGRFEAEVEWVDFEGSRGFGNTTPFRSADSGLFWFFAPDNWEMLVKILDGCGVNQHVWVFSAATTNVEYTLRVTDTQTGEEKHYFNPLGSPASAITDTLAFEACP